MKPGTKLTVDEFIAEYSKLPDTSRYELQDGEVVLGDCGGHGRLLYLNQRAVIEITWQAKLQQH